jgi:uncharacterized membrane protein
MISLKTGASIASIAAMLALANIAPVSTAYAADQTAPCYGVNSCKGQSDCKSGNHDCKGMNSCKGQGFKALSKSECKAEHGSTTPPK